MTTEWDIHDQIETAWLDGEEAGIAKGEARGRELGRAEERTELARKMVTMLGISPADAAKVSGLREEDLLRSGTGE